MPSRLGARPVSAQATAITEAAMPMAQPHCAGGTDFENSVSKAV